MSRLPRQFAAWPLGEELDSEAAYVLEARIRADPRIAGRPWPQIDAPKGAAEDLTTTSTRSGLDRSLVVADDVVYRAVE
jgi:hypothetical protein